MMVSVVFTIAVPLAVGLQVGQVGFEVHGGSQGGRAALCGEQGPKLLSEGDVDLSVLDSGEHGGWKRPIEGGNKERESESDGDKQIEGE